MQSFSSRWVDLANAFKKYSLEESIRATVKIGYQGVEVLGYVPHADPPLFGKEQIQLAKDILIKSKVQISNINAFTLYAIIDPYFPSWIKNNDAMRELRIQHTVNCIELASKIGSKNISTEAG